jgi:hypothetical protein
VKSKDFGARNRMNLQGASIKLEGPGDKIVSAYHLIPLAFYLSYCSILKM